MVPTQMRLDGSELLAERGHVPTGFVDAAGGRGTPIGCLLALAHPAQHRRSGLTRLRVPATCGEGLGRLRLLRVANAVPRSWPAGAPGPAKAKSPRGPTCGEPGQACADADFPAGAQARITSAS